MASKTKLDKNLLKDLVPLSNLSYDKLDELASKSVIEDLPAGRVLFRQGERDNRILYLISGQVELSVNGEKKPRLFKGRTQDAKQPLANTQPRPATAKAKGPITLVTVDPDLLEIIMDDTPLTATEFEVTEISGEDTTDWMLRFLQSRAFLKLPTENIQAILMRMEELPASKSEVLIRQGDKDDYYYIIQSGSCTVSRRPASQAQDIPLATLTEGDGFGEEALITNGKRNATITMQEDGVLMRLNKKDFLEYLAAPLIIRLNETEAVNKISGGALLIDVRKHDEYLQNHVEASVNIPLSMLRLKLKGLNPHREYVVACTDGTQSAAAAFLLTQHGFNCSILDGGLNAANLKLTGTPKAPAAVSAAPSSKRTVGAEKTRKAAEAHALKITQEADTARREAEQLAQQTATAERAKREAEQEIQRIQAMPQQQDDAELLVRQKAEQTRRQAEQELKKIEAARQANEQKQKALDDSLKHARQIAAEAAKAAEQSRQQAEKEAEEIRRKAHEEAKQLKLEMEETRRRFEQQATQAQEQEQAAIAQARHEAEEIKRKALEEAEQLRREMEQTRRQVMEHAARAQHKAEEQGRTAEQAQRHHQAEQQQRLKAEHEARRRQQESRNAEMKRKDDARRMAEEIKAKLEEAERQRQEEEERNRSEGLSVARATIKRKDGKIILESPEDVFIFKEPDVTPEQIEAELGKEEPAAASRDELPSFEIEESTKPVFKPVNTKAVHAKLAEQHASKKHQRKKRHLFALTATLLLAVGSSGVYIFMHPELFREHLIAKSESSGTTAKASVSIKNKQKREKSLKSDVQDRFDALLNEWKEITSR